MSLSSNRSKPARRPGDPNLRESLARSETMDPAAPQFIPSQYKHKGKESHSSNTSRSTRDGAPLEQMTKAEFVSWFESRIGEIISSIAQTTQIPFNVRENLNKELESVVAEFKERENLVQGHNLRSRIHYLEKQLQRAHDGQIPRIEELQSIIASQREELDIKENQLNGKRLLWLASHPTSSHQKALDTYQSTLLPGGLGNELVGARSLKSANSTNVRNRLSLPPTSLTRLSKSSLAAMEHAQETDRAEWFKRLENHGAMGAPIQPVFSSGRPNRIVTGATAPRTPSIDYEPREPAADPMAIVPFVRSSQPAHDLGMEYTEEFTKIFATIEGWCREYANMVNPYQDRSIASTNQGLWTYMMRLTYPDQQSAHSHVTALLSNEQTRFWFVMRMAMTYCFDEIMHPKNFLQFNHSVHTKLKAIKDRLDSKPVPSVETRQELIEEQSRLVERVIGSPDYMEFRNSGLMHHTKCLRDMLGPLLNKSCSRSKAGADLGVLVINCFDLGAKMWSARLSFQIIFPELLGAKFVAGTMIAKDHPKDNPFQLQTKQKRLKLVMTPSITMRDDTSLTIIAKNLHKANVLLMT